MVEEDNVGVEVRHSVGKDCHRQVAKSWRMVRLVTESYDCSMGNSTPGGSEHCGEAYHRGGRLLIVDRCHLPGVIILGKEFSILF
jgi:hypothetical protein